MPWTEDELRQWLRAPRRSRHGKFALVLRYVELSVRITPESGHLQRNERCPGQKRTSHFAERGLHVGLSEGHVHH
jgi:hypothetical protein